MTEKISRTKITSEDCVLPQMTGKYDLVFYASQRARAIIGGSPALIEGFENPANHSILVALEEIRQKKLEFNDLIESLASPYIETKQESYSDKVFKSEDFKEDFSEDEDEEYESRNPNYSSEEEYQD